MHSSNNPEWKCALFSINENESEFKNELNNEIKSSNDNQKNLIKLKNSDKNKHSFHSKCSSKIPKLQKNIKCLHHNNVEEKQSHGIHDINIIKNAHVTLKINIQQKNSKNLNDPIIKIKDPLNSKVILKKNKENQIKCSIIQNRNVLQTKNQSLTKRPIEKNILRNKNAQIINKENLTGKSVQQNVMKKEMIKNTRKQNLSNKSKLQNAAVKNLQSTKLNIIINSTQQNISERKFLQNNDQKNFGKNHIQQNNTNKKIVQRKNQENVIKKNIQAVSRQKVEQKDNQGSLGKMHTLQNSNKLEKNVAKTKMKTNEESNVRSLSNLQKTKASNYPKRSKINTPECLKRSQNTNLKKHIKSTEELEIEKITSLRKELEDHRRLSRMSMLKAISGQSVHPKKEKLLEIVKQPYLPKKENIKAKFKLPTISNAPSSFLLNYQQKQYVSKTSTMQSFITSNKNTHIYKTGNETELLKKYNIKDSKNVLTSLPLSDQVFYYQKPINIFHKLNDTKRRKKIELPLHNSDLNILIYEKSII
ncbi:GATA zinc finger domain-containing protein 14-like [Centruroides sculpturatus]|uniref:GATA zinc finger domain-containing protein 14-like n=1 Tax=Centruroides sculpturatus TaxID=218467 RepID=UPI000C6D9D01|nr:GATA zinc finger domain-containing protein 14-like [Centruroides sculpturatus]